MAQYESFKDEDGLPRVATSLERFFDPAYYRGEVPVFEPGIFHTTAKDYAYGWKEGDDETEAPDYPRRPTVVARPPPDPLEGHLVEAKSCQNPRGLRRLYLRGGRRFAREGEVFAFEPRTIRAERCEELEIVLENTDAVRHALMVPGLDPMFSLEFTGPGTRTMRLVTPDEDITLEFHCHVETHEKMGMLGRLIVGKGSPPMPRSAKPAAVGALYHGVGVVIAVRPRESRIVIDHEAISGFMAAMTMSYAVTKPRLLEGLGAGQRVRFTIDGGLLAIVDLAHIEE